MDETRFISFEYLNKIADHCPRAMSTYLLCFQHADEDLNCIITRDDVTVQHYMTYTRICNDLRALSREGLLEFTQTADAIHVTLACDVDGQ